MTSNDTHPAERALTAEPLSAPTSVPTREQMIAWMQERVDFAGAAELEPNEIQLRQAILAHLRQPTPAPPLKGPTALAGEWIDVRERLPDFVSPVFRKATRVIVFTKDGRVDIGRYIGGVWFADDEVLLGDITHWRHLPPPPPRSADGPTAAPGGFSTEEREPPRERTR